MLQHSALDVTSCLLSLALRTSSVDGMAYEVQNPRHAFVVTGNETHPGMLTVRVWPAIIKQLNDIAGQNDTVTFYNALP